MRIFSIKVIYALVALSVLLIFLVINLILKNRDLKDDLRDTQERLDMQTNEFARKEYYLATENYYAPTQRSRRQPVWFRRKNQRQYIRKQKLLRQWKKHSVKIKKTGPVKADRKSRREKKASAEAGKTGDGRNAG